MNATKKGLVKTALAAALCCAGYAQAAVVVDLFTDPPGGQVVTDSTFGGGGVSNEVGAYPSIIGGYRELFVEQTSTSLAGGNSTLRVNNGFLSHSNDSGVGSYAKVTWDGVLPGGMNVDLTAGGADRFITTVFDVDLGFDYRITLKDADGSVSALQAQAQYSVNVGSPDFDSPVNAAYLFSWFNLASGNTYCDGGPSAPCDPNTQLLFSITSSGGPIDFKHITSIQLELFDVEGRADIDLTIGSITTNVPEPGGLALVGAALLGAGVARRKQRKQ